MITDRKQLEKMIIEAIKTVYDPEIPVDVYELGLIYEININDEANVDIKMTLTSPSCPAAEELPGEVELKTKQVPGVTNAAVTIVFDPPWEKSMMSEEAQLELGFM
ncbi:MAG: SUF system Fe-S cluster assembly protein [Bacteroidetes bacterium]|nr:SUF system Fe-S cluster assembly protein [Bacteroidota bacterium]HET6245467.1 SUF system Fe-S cluster assembly protein [Bacteroidia bacterium]